MMTKAGINDGEHASRSADTRDFNPGARLHRLLKEAVGNGRGPILRVWAGVLGLPEGDCARIFGGLAEVRSLAIEVRTRIEMIDDASTNKELYLRPFPQIDKALGQPNLVADWNEVGRHLDAATLQILEFCADLLARQAPEREIPRTELERLRTDLQDLLTDVLSARSLPPHLRDLMVVGLRRIQVALDTYEIHGAQGLRQALAENLGALVLVRRDGDTVLQSDESARFVKILSCVDKLTAIAQRLPVLAAGVAQVVGRLTQ